MSLLSCKEVSFAYEGETVLEKISFEVSKGEYLCIIGENGAGKSTLLKGILNLKKPVSGQIFTGEGLRKNEIGYLPQQTQIQKDFPASVYEVALSGRLNQCGMRPFYNRADKEDALEKLAWLSISDLKERCYRELSGGQQRRVLLARALCATKKILFLDEPTAGLDPLATEEFYKLLWELNQKRGLTIVMVTHDRNAALDYASHILFLGENSVFLWNEGRISAYSEEKTEAGGNRMSVIIEMFSYPFMVRAAIVGLLVSLCASLLGTSLVLKRYAMIGDGLSHVGFAALAVAYACNLAPLAVGVMTVSLTTGMNTDVCNYMFGSILAMSSTDVWISIVLSVAVVILFLVFYSRIFAVTFDENFALATGTHSNVYNMVIALLTAVTVVLGMRMMGTLLISSLIVFPALSAMRVCKKYKSVIICSVAVALVCFCVGLFVSYQYSTPTGASIVIANIMVFFIFLLIERVRQQHT